MGPILTMLAEAGDQVLENGTKAPALTGGGGMENLGATMTNIGTAVTGMLNDVITPVMSFMLTTPLLVIMLGLSFTGAGFGFVGRALKTARK